MKNITFITSNSDKLNWLRRFTKLPIEHLNLDLHEIQSLDPAIVIEHKAKDAYKIIKKPVLVDDICLTFNALGKLPGPLIRWFLEELGDEGLCVLLDGYQDRSAKATVTYGYYDGETFKAFEASMNGTITDKPKQGPNGFGWNSVFIPEGYKKTWAEMSDEDTVKTSIRKKALLKLEKYLRKL